MATAEDDERMAIVIDNGTGVLKAGFAGDDAPRVLCPAVIGTPKSQDQMTGAAFKARYLGEEAVEKKGVLSLQHPMDHGVVKDWADMEHLWQDVFHQLHVQPADQPVLLTDPPLNPLANRETMVEVMFEKFDVPAFYVMTQGVLSLFASGRHMGVMVDCGEGVTHVMPIEGLFVRPQAVQRLNLAGRDLTLFLQRLMMERAYNVHTSAGLEVVRQVKEDLCYVAHDYEAEMTASQTTSSIEKGYELPDGQVITLNDHRFRVPEALFQPAVLGGDQAGLHQMVYKSIMSCDIDSRALFYSNVVLCGGSTFFPGFGNRLKKELTTLAPRSMKSRVLEPPDRKYSVWIGGSIVASLSTFRGSWVSRQQYLEHGPAIVHSRCS